MGQATVQDRSVDPSSPAVPLLSQAECWAALPRPVSGCGQPLPPWARATARFLPRTTAAMLLLDHQHRTTSPVPAPLRAKLRGVVAEANRCETAKKEALADLQRAEGSDDELSQLSADCNSGAEDEQLAAEFVRLLTVAAPTIPDALFHHVRARFGTAQLAAMILLAAYGNFQDRLLWALNLARDGSDPLPPVDLAFPDGVLQVAPLVPSPPAGPDFAPRSEHVVAQDAAWSAVPFEQWQVQLEQQRCRVPRLPIPQWAEIRDRLPSAMANSPTRIVWTLVSLGYAPELQVPWLITTRTQWSERPLPRVLEESLFWVQTKAVGCCYCMGHCEMLLEVAGLDRSAVLDRLRRLSGDDWSGFSAEEQRAFAYARTLSQSPWKLTPAGYAELAQDWGAELAFSLVWWLARGLYMTRISDGFQLPLERENVFAH